MSRKSIVLCWMVVCLVAVFAGCKDEVEQSALDKFIARTTELDGPALDDTLRSLAAGDGPYNAYASYLLGNRFYQTASDSAREMGWGGAAANALLDSAEIHFNHAVALDSTFIEPIVNLGSLWDDRAEQMGSRQERDARLGQAKQFYEMALQIEPTDEKARCNLGALYLRQRRVKDALREFQTVLDHDEQSALAHYNMAIMFAEDKIYREALAEWELASKYDPDGDIGDRSRANIKIVKDLMNTPDPGAVK